MIFLAYKYRQRQSGAALMVAMVLMFMLTILGVSAMRDATLEGKLAANAAQKEVTFQAAESATDTVLAITDASHPMAIESVICSPDPAHHQLPKLSVSGVQETDVKIYYGGRTPSEGDSLGGIFGTRRFVVTANSALPGASTSTRISQGVELRGAIAEGSTC